MPHHIDLSIYIANITIAKPDAKKVCAILESLHQTMWKRFHPATWLYMKCEGGNVSTLVRHVLETSMCEHAPSHAVVWFRRLDDASAWKRFHLARCAMA